MDRLWPQWTAILAVLIVTVTACTFPPAATPTPSPTPTQPPPGSATPSASPPEAIASEAPDLGTIPSFTGGDLITTTFAGLRVRQLPGTEHPVVTDLLGFDAELEVLMGPIVVDELGWYLVSDTDREAPDFDEGWVAAGFEPEANVRSTGAVATESSVVVSLAQTGDAEFGPISIPDEHHVIRWLATDPEGVRCQFSVSLTAGSGDPTPAIRSTVGASAIPGTLQSVFFVGQPALRGQLFLTAETDCAWTLAVIRVDPDPEPTATP